MEGQPPVDRRLPAYRGRKHKRPETEQDVPAGHGNKRKKPEPVEDLQEYSSVSQRIMASMGYKPGEGLGRLGTGITAPITEDVHKGRRGLGYILEGLEKEDVKWEEEEVSYNQQPEWLLPCKLPVPTAAEFAKWVRYGEKKDTIKDETDFCSPDILLKILDSKSVFDQLGNKEFLDARQRSNPFETIKGAIFQNRAAMKMANIDAVFNFMFTSPKKKDGSHLLGPFDVLYFADICAGPGGFSEYVLWRKKWHAKGFGLTLKEPDNASDFKLEAFLAAPCETFDPHYGVGGYEGDGDITVAENLTTFKEYVCEQAERKGVHFVMADGGISVEGQENIQEILTKQLVLCQYICALSILREGGHFLCKVFDMFTPFSVGLFYLLYRCFKRVCIFKPVTSRPANSERYVICYDYQPGSSVVHDYLFDVNLELCKLKQENSNLDILEVVPMEVLHEDQAFYTYIQAFNDSFGVNQAVHLKKIQYFVKNVTLIDVRQADSRRQCLDLWKVPVGPRTAPFADSKPLQVFNGLWEQLTPVNESEKPPDAGVLQSSNFTSMNKDNLDFFKDIYSWKWGWACGKRFMLVGMGRNMVHAWDIKGAKDFRIRREFPGLELPRGTVLEVELVSEFEGERGQKRRDTVYIVDVIAIHGTVCGNKNIKDRQLLAEKLCKVINKPCRKATILLKAKPYYRCADLHHQFKRLSLKEHKGQSSLVPTYQLTENSFIAPLGIVVFKTIKDPWQLHLSKTGKFYYFNSKTGESIFECPPTSVAPYLSVSATKHFWKWNRTIFKELCGHDIEDTTELTRSYLCECIDSFKTKP